MEWQGADIIGASAAGATFLAVLVALGLGLYSVRETRHLQKREFRYRLLDEVRQWAERAVDLPSQHRTIMQDMVSTADAAQQRLLTFAHIVEVQEYLAVLITQQAYMNTLSKRFGQGLAEATESMGNDIREYAAFLKTWQNKYVKDITKQTEDDSRSADVHMRQVAQSTIGVLELIANIKAEGLA